MGHELHRIPGQHGGTKISLGKNGTRDHPTVATDFKNYSETSAEETKSLHLTCFEIYPLNDSQATVQEDRTTNFSSFLYGTCTSNGKRMLGKTILHCQIPYNDKMDRF